MNWIVIVAAAGLANAFGSAGGLYPLAVLAIGTQQGGLTTFKAH